MYKYLGFLIFIYSATLIDSKRLDVLYEWSWVDYLWDDEAQRTEAIQSGRYDFTKPIIIDVDVWKGRPDIYGNPNIKTFITVVRRPGVPASLTIISNRYGHGGPLLKPYPDWSWAAEDDCDSITSVYRVAIDECDRLWVLDTGKIGDNRKCPAQLLAFDLHTDQLIKRVKIPNKISENSLTKTGQLVTPIVETQGDHCHRTHVYMADVAGSALVIYNGTSLWRLESPIYSYQEAAANFTIAGESFSMNDGVLGMAISPPINDHRYLVFRPLASFDLISADTSSLHVSYKMPVSYTFVSGALPSQAVAMASTRNGVLFFGLIENHAIACWNMRDPVLQEKIGIVDQDIRYYQFISGMKIIERHTTGRNDELWIAMNRYQKIASGTQNFDEINFRVMSHRIDHLLGGTVCDRSSQFERFHEFN